MADKKDKTGRNIKKLSNEHPSASIDHTKEQLNQLRHMVNESAQFGEQLNQAVAKLRQVAAPEGQPFIFTNSLAENKKLLKVVFRDCADVKMRGFTFGNNKALLVYLDGMTDTRVLEENIIKPLGSESGGSSETGNETNPVSVKGLPDMYDLINEKLSIANVTIISQATKAIEAVMTGRAILFIDGVPEILAVGEVKHVKRSVESGSEDVIRGPHDAFNETLSDNIVLIRRRARDHNVKVKILQVGERTKTSVAIMYAANLVKPGLVEEVERRIRNIKIDRVLASLNIEELIIDHPWSPFPQLQTTERPDKTVSAIYEGRVAILVDNTPATILAPATYALVMQTPEDYTTSPSVSSLIRLSRHISAFIAIYLPAIYVAIVSYHPGIMPTAMAISVAELRARTPFPSFIEALAMEVILEIFQEAIIRLPSKVAGAAGVVGALVIGSTVVEAGLVNPLLVVVIAMTAIASYTMPSWGFSMALRFFRVPVLILASVLGLYGVMIGLLVITVHLCSMRSFG
ncbi:MAG: gerBA, partial [Sporomusa sp.]|nr:gerBA [Sporomusa sp.]